MSDGVAPSQRTVWTNAEVLRLCVDARQSAAREIAQFVEDQGIARTDNLLRALAGRIRERYEVK